MNQVNTKRRTVLVQPRFQLRIVGSFFGLAALAMILQFLFLGYRVSSHAATIEGMGGQIADEVPAMMLQTLAFSVVVLLPLVFGMGVLLTQRIAGPAYRFEEYLRAVARGEQLGPCKLRAGDHLQSLCDAINDATEPVRRRTLEREEESSEDEDEPAGALPVAGGSEPRPELRVVE